MREGARVSSQQQLIKSYSNWFTFASLHKSAKQKRFQVASSISKPLMIGLKKCLKMLDTWSLF